MKEKYRNLINYLLDRLSESSTWQGVAFLITLVGAKVGGNVDWGGAAALGGAVSGIIKIVFADTLKGK